MENNGETYIRKNDAVDLLMQRAEQLVGVYGDLGGAASGAAKLVNVLIPAVDVKPVEIIDAGIESALQILDGIRIAGKIDYSNYSRLHDAISLIGLDM